MQKYENIIYVTYPLNPLSQKGDLPSLRSKFSYVVPLFSADNSCSNWEAVQKYENIVYVTYPLSPRELTLASLKKLMHIAPA